jgi:hypothetical protein
MPRSPSTLRPGRSPVTPAASLAFLGRSVVVACACAHRALPGLAIGPGTELPPQPRPVPAMTPGARRRRLRGCDPVRGRCCGDWRRSARRPSARCNGGSPQALYLWPVHEVRAVSRFGPPDGSRPLQACRRPRARPGPRGPRWPRSRVAREGAKGQAGEACLAPPFGYDGKRACRTPTSPTAATAPAGLS